ncbi:MFS sugar transporter [Aspergillus violaceofuscus CBS 115571]|uniref:MFS sugar transporter n=1 Tax=Aspergillus violaceofuscus (strain CBS 115571) TaxID=1450538 RepID=A0A2V5HH99_ASPV1|nr:MFS sugar transporter [Aspergillus violaceofuscus CBS 115571]
MTVLTGKPLSLAITATAGSGFLLFGYDQGVMSGLLTGTAFTRTFPQIDTTSTGHGSSSLQGTVVAIYEIGCFLGALIALFAGEKVGRRMCIIAGCIILSVGAAIQCSAYGIPQLIVGRIVAGVGNGLNTSTIPVWHSELSKASSRGKGLAIELTINIFGVMTAYWVDYGMSYVNSEAQFRFPIALQILFAIITLLGVIVLPESPRWLISHGQRDKAQHIIWAVQPNADQISESDTLVTTEVEEISRAIAEEQAASQEGSFGMIFSNGPQKFFYRTLLGMGGQFMQQMSGVNLITYYNTVIFENSVGMSHNLALLMAGFNGVAYFISTFVPVWTIDRLGRRKLMLFAAAGQCGCMAVLAGTVYDGGHAAGIVATVMLFLFNFFFAVGLLAIPWLLPAEYAPLAIRSRAAALATATNWIFTFLVVEITPVSIDSIGYRTYIYFAGDEAKPVCLGCKRRGDTCEWRRLGSFREANLKVLEPEHPSMNQAAGRASRQSKFKILNVIPARSAKTTAVKQSRRSVDERVASSAPLGDGDSYENLNACTGPKSPSPSTRIVDPPLSPRTAERLSPLSHESFRNSDRLDPQQSAVGVERAAHSSPDASHYHPYMHSSPDFVVDELAAVQNLTGNPGQFPHSASNVYHTIPSPMFDQSVFSDAVRFTNDVFVPGSAYEALHTTLRNRQLWTARPDIPSRGRTPEIVPEPGITVLEDCERTEFLVISHQRTGREFELHPERENVLWQNYLNEICLWLDMFDNHRHFASTFPQMAKSAPHLRYSILALSARQMERKQNRKSQSESLSLYQEAIHLLLPELESKSTPVIASCVILCVLEMLSCNPKEWRRHLDGCAYLIQAAEINGFSGKEEQALFWCFARMDVCGGLISEEETIIPIRNWIPRDMTPADAAQLFLASNVYAFDTYANYTVFLCAQTLGVLFGSARLSTYYHGILEDGHSYVDRWQQLLHDVEQCIWEPTLSCLRSSPTPGKAEDPFNAATPNEVCPLACTTDLRYFGFEHPSVRMMSHHSEHAAIVQTLTRIERETGWATSWRAEDLREFWGDEEEAEEMEENMRRDEGARGHAGGGRQGESTGQAGVGCAAVWGYCDWVVVIIVSG